MNKDDTKYLHIKHLRKEDKDELFSLSGQDITELNDRTFIYSEDAKRLTTHYDVSKEDARKIIGLVGYKNAVKCLEFLFNSTLNDQFYIPFVQCVAEGKIKIGELNSSPIELLIKDCIEKFNLSKKQLEQKEYRRKDPETGTIRSAENPLISKHIYEHLDTRMLDNYD